MPRGRPRLYHTEEERIIANRAKSTRSYRKRKDPLNIRSFRATESVIPGSTQAGLPEGIDPTDLAGWLELLNATNTRYEDYKHGRIGHFVDQLCIRYLNSTRSNNIFQDALLEVGGFLSIIARCHRRVLQLAGVGVELETVERIQRGVRECEAALEDAFTYALCGRAELIEMRENGRLVYQSYTY
ncbi:hypothetical protein ONZ45_g7021 [Pleurotus djamor]|nr:hypothetical protein ONZ45_g7021 [Pleurotus djamor]